MKITHKLSLPMCLASYMTLCNESYVSYQDLKTWCKLLSSKLTYRNRDVQTSNKEEDFLALQNDKNNIFVVESKGVALRKTIDYLRDHYMVFFDAELLADLFKLSDKYINSAQSIKDEEEEEEEIAV